MRVYACKGELVMKKNLAKIFASASIVVALILIMILIVTAFGGIETKEFESKLVRGLIMTIAIIYMLLACITLTLLFVRNDAVQEITVRKEKGGAVRVSARVVEKLIKNSCGCVEGVKCKKVALLADDFGVRLKLNIKVVDKDVLESETYIRTIIEDAFLKEFGFAFSAIEIRVMELTPKYKPNKEEIDAKVEQELAEIKEQAVEEAQERLDQAQADAEENPTETHDEENNVPEEKPEREEQEEADEE